MDTRDDIPEPRSERDEPVDGKFIPAARLSPPEDRPVPVDVAELVSAMRRRGTPVRPGSGGGDTTSRKSDKNATPAPANDTPVSESAASGDRDAIPSGPAMEVVAPDATPATSDPHTDIESDRQTPHLDAHALEDAPPSTTTRHPPQSTHPAASTSIARLIEQGKQTRVPGVMRVEAGRLQNARSREPFHVDVTRRAFEENKRRLLEPEDTDASPFTSFALLVTMGLVVMVLYLAYIGGTLNSILPDFLRHEEPPMERLMRDAPVSEHSMPQPSVSSSLPVHTHSFEAAHEHV